MGTDTVAHNQTACSEGGSGLKGMSSFMPLPSEEEEAEPWDSQRGLGHQGSSVFRHIWADTEAVTEAVAACTGPAQLKPAGIQVLKGTLQHELPSLPKKLSPTDIHLQRKN